MTILSSDLQKICNYREDSKHSLPRMTLRYLETVDTYTDEYKRYLKMKNRELTIDALLDEEKVQDYKNRDHLDPLDNESRFIPSVKTQLMSVNVQCKNYTDLSDIYVDVMNTLNHLTKSPMNIPQNLNIKFTHNRDISEYENTENHTRKIILNIQLASSMIAMYSRKGPPHTIILGFEAYRYLVIPGYLNMKTDGISTGLLNGMNVIPSNLIDDNKIILTRCEGQTDIGLNVVNCSNDMRYFIKETPSSWSKSIHWFEIN